MFRRNMARIYSNDHLKNAVTQVAVSTMKMERLYRPEGLFIIVESNWKLRQSNCMIIIMSAYLTNS